MTARHRPKATRTAGRPRPAAARILALLVLLLSACGGDPAAVSVSGDDATPPAEQADGAPEIPSDSDGEAPAATGPEPTQSEAGEDGGQTGEPDPPATEGPADQPAPPPDETAEPPPDDDPDDAAQPLHTPTGRPPSPPPDGLVLSLNLDHNTLRHGEQLRGRLTIENRSDRPIEATHGSGCPYTQGLYQGGEYRGGRLGGGCTMMLTYTTWEPGEVDERTIVLEAIDPAGDPLPPGTYLAVAGVDATDGWWIAPPIEIEIVE